MKSISIMVVVTVLSLVGFGCKKNARTEAQKASVITDTTLLIGFETIKLADGRYVAACHDANALNVTKLFCIDATGNRVWDILVIDSPAVNSIAPLPDGGFVVAGSVISKYSASGEKLWSSTNWMDSMVADPDYGGVAYYPVLCAAPNGTLYLYYGMSSATTLSRTSFMTRMTEGGDVSGTSRIAFPGGQDTLWYDVFKMTADNTGVYATGSQWYLGLTSTIFFWIYDYFSFKANADGSIQWVNAPNYPLGNLPQALSISNSGATTVAIDIVKGVGNSVLVGVDSNAFGQTNNTYDAGHADYYGDGAVSLKIFDANSGNVTAGANLNFPKGNIHPYLTASKDGGYLAVFAGNVNQGYFTSSVAGNQFNFYSGSNITLEKVDANLNRLWSRTIDSPYPTRPFGVYQTSDGGYLIFACIATFGKHQSDLAVFKVNAQGSY